MAKFGRFRWQSILASFRKIASKGHQVYAFIPISRQIKRVPGAVKACDRQAGFGKPPQCGQEYRPHNAKRKAAVAPQSQALWPHSRNRRTDKDILAWAEREARVPLTFDKDFGELAWHFGLPASSGVVLFRLPMPAAAEVGAVLAARIGERTDWAGHFRSLNRGVSACARLQHNNLKTIHTNRNCSNQTDRSALT
jgi:predicted nuclease of predicted toxin-antitoxin system